ncbi:MAG: 3-hydroxyisobutyrate dehydrogenase-like beta-hydroxyacid dehydrogenase [Chitinophagales bacterium]|jgi:3-hydroxyisobutyrate dehydrogenase-like beta-hydroxyacid dehydrogenase
MKIGFIGLGVMGSPIAANLLTFDEHSVTVFDIDEDKVQRLVHQGANKATSIETAVNSADLVFTSLPGPKQIKMVAFGDKGLLQSMRESTTWIDLSTNNLEMSQRINQLASEKHIDFLDAPVSGGDEGARAASLTIMTGGEKSVFEKCLPVLQMIGKEIKHVGPSGAGYAAKIAQVVLCYLHSLALSEALMLGVKGGVDKQEMLSIIQNSTGRSYVADRYGPPILNGDYDPSFSLGLAHKDMKLAQEMARNLGIKLPMCDLTTATYARAIERYGFDDNHLKAVRLLEEGNNTFLQI